MVEDRVSSGREEEKMFSREPRAIPLGRADKSVGPTRSVPVGPTLLSALALAGGSRRNEFIAAVPHRGYIRAIAFQADAPDSVQPGKLGDRIRIIPRGTNDDSD